MKINPISILVSVAVASLSVALAQESVPFPDEGILPKEEIGAARFLAEHPEYDERGVVVAIFDTGVDPGAAGLAKTPEGRPKVIDIIDATGSGDVMMGEPVKVEKGSVTGLSGRVLRLGADWKMRDGEVRLGLKAAWELYPGDLIGRLKEKRRESWDEAQRNLERALRKAVDDFKEAHPEPNEEQKAELEDLEARVSACEEMGKRYEDPGPVFDCVLFHDDERWQAVVDTDEDGDLSDEKVLSEYDVAQEFATFGAEDLLNFGVHVYGDGKVLSLVMDSGTHGTHVAGIVGAYFPDDPALNGLAPGAQIVSVKIGDTRLDGMETGHALRRAITAARTHEVDLVNMSYGEPTRTPNESGLMDALRELIHEDGVIFVSSAGNEGPALSTLGAPGGTMSACIGVGAYVSPALMRAGYSILEELPGTMYTWTSRGPTKDGDLGVDITAPGGAISPVPRWALTREQLMNGTSMASPNACGGLALVLSGLKAEGVPYSPEGVKRALTATGERIEGVDVFGQGHGMLQVDRAFERVRGFSDAERALPRFDVAVDQGRGVYLRGGVHSGKRRTFRVTVTPGFRKADERAVLADFQARIVLKPTADWIAAPSFYVASSEANSFDIEVNPEGLEEGAHYGEVLGFVAGREESGPVIRVPVTVVRPVEADWGPDFEWREEIEFGPGTIRRFFLDLPDGATWAELELRALDLEGSRRMIAHVQFADPHEAHRNMGTQFGWNVDAETNARKREVFAVRGGTEMELCLAQYWSSLGGGRFEATLRLHGTAAHSNTPPLVRGDKVRALAMHSALRPESIAPSASVTAYRRALSPSGHTLRARTHDARDAMREGREAHELVLEYPFELSESARVTPRFPALNDRLYEMEFESQLQMLFDGNKRLLATDDTYPDGFDLEKGSYVLRLHLRLADRSRLEKLENLALELEFALGNRLTIPVYDNADNAITGDGPWQGEVLADGRNVPLFLGEPEWDQLPENCRDGDVLVGSLVLQPGAPEALAITCIVRKEGGGKGKADDEKDIMLDLRRKALATLLAKEKGDEFDAVAANTLETYPGDVPTLRLILKRRAGKDWRQHAAGVTAAADAVIAVIDETALATYFGTRHEGEKADEERQAMEEKREALTEALAWKVRAQIAAKEPYAETLERLGKWADPEDGKFVLMNRARYGAEKRWGRLLGLLEDDAAKKKSDAKRRLEILRKLEWKHWIEAEERRLLRAFPEAYAPF